MTEKHTFFSTQTRQIFVGYTLLCVVLLCGGCFPGVYKLDIPQGNVLETEKIDQLKTGMSKRQVRYLLGTPLMIDSFNQDHWEYYYSLTHYKPRDSDPHFYQARLILRFEKGQLTSIDKQIPENSEGTDLPASLPVSPSPAPEPDLPEPDENAPRP